MFLYHYKQQPDSDGSVLIHKNIGKIILTNIFKLPIQSGLYLSLSPFIYTFAP
jgi:hypothetical protein